MQTVAQARIIRDLDESLALYAEDMPKSSKDLMALLSF